MIDVHTHAIIGWTHKSVEECLRICDFDKALLAALPIDHWSTDLTEGCARLIAEFPERLVGLVGVHPPDMDRSLREIEIYGKKGFVGIKLMPTVGYYPDDEKYRRIFEEVNARKWIVLTHCGYCSPGPKPKDLPQSTRYSDPYYIEPLARVYTDTDFILAHGGGWTYFPHAAELTHYLKNVYIDTCPGHGPRVLKNGREWLNVLNWEHVLYGTDMVFGDLKRAANYRQIARNLGDVLTEIGHADKTQAVMHDNAARLLRKHGVAVTCG